jgi:flavodoxin
MSKKSLSNKTQDEIAEAVKVELGEEEHKDFYEFIDELEDKLNIPIVLKLNNYKEYVQAYTKYEKLSQNEKDNFIKIIKESDFVADELHKVLNIH